MSENGVRIEMYANCGMTNCFDCPFDDCIAEIKTKRHSKPSAEQLQKHYEKQRAKRAGRLQNGLCVSCGRELPDGYGFHNCAECLVKFRRSYRRKMDRDGRLPRELLDGINRCSRCGKYPPATGYKLCLRCLAQARRALSHTATHHGKKPENHFTAHNEVFWSGKADKVKGTG